MHKLPYVPFSIPPTKCLYHRQWDVYTG